MSGWAIVALPSEDDYVWKISSQKVPHVTLLYLGDHEIGPESAQIESYVSHAAKFSLTRFGLSVDRRGKLGDKDADVLFFDHYGIERLEQFRSFLLKNNTINQAYLSTEQFEGWTPHLTLGYPTDPAKVDPREYHKIHWVEFDRIAIWFGDFEGPEFVLKNYDDLAEVAMSNSGSRELEHHGIKGMHWGIRRENPGGGSGGSSSKTEKAATKAQAKWEKKAGSTKTLFEIHNATIRQMNKVEVKRINNKPEFKNKDFSNDSPLRQKYYQDFENTFMKVMNSKANEQVGVSPDGSKRLKYEATPDGDINIGWESLKHDFEDGIFQLHTDATGYVTSIELTPGALAQSDGIDGVENLIDDLLSHHGIKGMHWGKRRTEAELDSASTDSAKAKATSAKIKSNRGRTDSVSSQDLQHLVNRMNLEQQYSRLSAQPSGFAKGHSTIKAILGVAQTAQQVHTAVNSPLVKDIRKQIDKKKAEKK